MVYCLLPPPLNFFLAESQCVYPYTECFKKGTDKNFNSDLYITLELLQRKYERF